MASKSAPHWSDVSLKSHDFLHGLIDEANNSGDDLIGLSEKQATWLGQLANRAKGACL